jgi:hypothetical protein
MQELRVKANEQAERQGKVFDKTYFARIFTLGFLLASSTFLP